MCKISSLITALLLLFIQTTFTQPADSVKKITTFSGSVGITNNGFSIIPTFSLNSPAVVTLLSWKRKKFSIEPDIRLSLDARKGGMLLWLRYRVIEKKKFSLRIGAHPAFNIQIQQITENGVSSEISQIRRFIASEIVPNYQIKPNWSVGMYYLQGNGLQKNGVRTTHFLTFNTNISNIKLGGDVKFQFIPSVYYLFLDGYEGTYCTATGILTKGNIPFMLQSSFNQTFRSNLPGNKAFLWNVTLAYFFNKQFMRIK